MDGDTVYGEGTFDIDTESLTEPTLPTIEGYDVLGWEDYTLPFESREAWEDGHVLTIHLNKSLHTYTATFVDGETVLYEKGFTIEDIDTFEAPPVPEKEGFTGAWEPFTLTAADITIRVIWTPVQGEDTKAPDDTTDTDVPPVDPGDQNGNWLWWLLIALLLLIVIALIVIFFILKNKKDDDHNDPEPPAPVVVAEPEPTPEPEPVVEPEPTPVVVEAEPAVVKVTYLSATSRAVINLCDLDARFEDGDTVNLETLKEMKLVSKKEKRLKVLGSGTITKALTVEADYFSGSAADKIRAAGGTPVQKN